MKTSERQIACCIPPGFNYPCCLSDEVNVREERFHSCHLSRCLTSSRGKTSACGTCQRFVYFDEFRARQNRMSPLRRPERRNQLSLVLASLDTRRHSEPSSERIVTNANSISYAFFSALRRNASRGARSGRAGLLA